MSNKIIDVNEVQEMIDSLGIKLTDEEIKQKQSELEKISAEKQKLLRAKRAEYTKRYKEKHPETVAVIRQRHYRKFVAENPDYFRKKTHESYLRRSAIKYECPCVSLITRASLKKHLGSLKHQEYAAQHPDAVYPWDNEQ